MKLASEAGLAGCSVEDWSGTEIYDIGLAAARVAAAPLWHSLCADRAVWSRIREDLAAHRQLILLDAPAHGDSDAPPGRADHRVPCRVGVRRGVSVRRLVTAADVPAFEADPQVEPLLTCGQAVLAAIDGAR